MQSVLQKSDPAIWQVLQKEALRQEDQIELIASENSVSVAVLEALGSVLTNKYAEGYPGRRYYGGCEVVDQAEELAQERARKLFQCAYANVQPHAGAQANLAAFLALMKPGDTFLGMDLNAGGHLTHGSPATLSGKWFTPKAYGVNEQGRIDYNQVREIAKKTQPKVIIAGGSSYPFIIDFKIFREIADEVGAFLLADMAHFAGLVAAGIYPSPLPYAHVVTTTTHKTLRGPRGGMILTNDFSMIKKLDSAVFPGAQGGPLMHVIAAKAVAFKEALDPRFKEYSLKVVHNAQTLAQSLLNHGISVIGGGTETHLLLADLRPLGLQGKMMEGVLEQAHLTCNKNQLPNDPQPPQISSGLRFGSPAPTTRGFGKKEFDQVGGWIAEILLTASKIEGAGLQACVRNIRTYVRELCAQFPLYPEGL